MDQYTNTVGILCIVVGPSTNDMHVYIEWHLLAHCACVRLVAWLVPGRLLWAGSTLTPQAPAAAEQPQPPAAAQQPNRVNVYLWSLAWKCPFLECLFAHLVMMVVLLFNNFNFQILFLFFPSWITNNCA